MSKKIHVGDIVIVRDRSRLPAYQVRPAIVTNVRELEHVDVNVFAEGGVQRDLTSLPRIEAHEDEALGWHWPVRE